MWGPSLVSPLRKPSKECRDVVLWRVLGVMGLVLAQCVTLDDKSFPSLGLRFAFWNKGVLVTFGTYQTALGIFPFVPHSTEMTGK